MKERLRFIADQEGCVFKGGDDTEKQDIEQELIFDAILDLSHGDMRRAVTALQSAHRRGIPCSIYYIFAI
jgi:DNA polymerase III delta prime subunit